MRKIHSVAADRRSLSANERRHSSPRLDPSTIIRDGAIAIAGSEIVGIGSTEKLSAQFQANEIIDAADHIVMPGLINTHTHSPMSLFRGLSDDLELAPWLERMRDAARQVIRAETVALGAELAYAEMLLSGTTTALDMYFFPETLAAVAKRVGFRIITGPVFVAHEVSDKIPAKARMARGREFMEAYRNDSLVVPCVMPHSPHDVPLNCDYSGVIARSVFCDEAIPAQQFRNDNVGDCFANAFGGSQ